MARIRYYYHEATGEFKTFPDPAKEVERKGSHAIIQDSMDPVEHPCEPGRFFDSKSQFRRVTKAHGCVEVGSGGLPKRREYEPQGVKEDIRRALEKLGG